MPALHEFCYLYKKLPKIDPSLLRKEDSVEELEPDDWNPHMYKMKEPKPVQKPITKNIAPDGARPQMKSAPLLDDDPGEDNMLKIMEDL